MLSYDRNANVAHSSLLVSTRDEGWGEGMQFLYIAALQAER
jgi:hypothetical protein